MIRLLTVFSLWGLINLAVYAGGENKQAGARSSGMSHASVTHADMWGAFNNQASIARLTRMEFGFYYENKYMLKELGFKAAALIYPTKSGTIALSANHFGFSAYNESKIGLAYSKPINQFISFAVQLDYFIIHLEEAYGNTSFVTFEAGLLADMSDNLVLGVHVFNPVNARISRNTGEKAPVIIRAGTSYKVTDNFHIDTEVEKDINKKAIFKAGFEYKLNPKVMVRAGIATGPSSYSFGVGINTGNLNIDISAAFHQVLGFTPQASSSFKL